jgi:hypothetical protein
VAFSHVTIMSQWHGGGPRPFDADHSGREELFSVDFNVFPFTYLLSLCEVLLDPFNDDELRDTRWTCVDDIKQQLARASAFIVWDVQVESKKATTTLSLTLRLWEDSLKEEGRKACSIWDMKTISIRYISPEASYQVQHEQFYRATRPEIVVEVDHSQNTPVITTGLMKILLLEARLKKFAQQYFSGENWLFAVQFYNARDSEESLYEVNLWAAK